MPDITNYAYIWYNEENPLSAIGVLNANIIFQYVTSYSYPCYLANNDVSSLSDTNKHQLLHDEIGFIRDIMDISELQGIKLVQIPRVLYDLLGLIYFVETRTHLSFITISCITDFHKNYASYISSSIKQYSGHDNFKNHILQLNAFILNKIGYIVGGGKPPSSYEIKTDKPASTSKPVAPADVRSFLSDRNKACESILEHILQAKHISYTHPQIHLNLTPRTKELFRQVLTFELQESSGYTILYRGAVLENDSLLRRSSHEADAEADADEEMLQSVSFNTSILSGCIHDDTACTLFYMEPTSTHERVGELTNSSKNDKIIYLIKKFLKGDNSDEDSLFFIPPIHPLLQLNAQGELFHPRTKVNLNDLKDKWVSGLNCENSFIQQCDYLQSDKPMEQLNALYQRFKATGIIDKWYTNPEHQKQYEDARKAKTTSRDSIRDRGVILDKGVGMGGRTQRRSRMSNKRMKVTRSVDRLRGRGRRRRTCKRRRLR